MTMIDLFPLYLSLKVAVTATILTLSAGLPLSYLLARKRFFGRELLDTLIAMPLVLPPTVLGYYLLVALGRRSPIGRTLEDWFGVTLVFTWKGAAIAAFIVSLPLLVKSARTAIEEVDPRLEDAARTLGRSEWDVLRTITLPLAWRGIGAGLALAFARALGEFGATLMVAGNIPGLTQTMPIAIYDAVQAGNDSLANILVLIMTVTAVAVLLVVGRLSRKRGQT